MNMERSGAGQPTEDGAYSAAGFLEQNQEIVHELRSIFHGGDYESFMRFPEKLNALRERYQNQSGRSGAPLPVELFEAIVTEDYLNRREAEYQKLSGEGGLYLPLQESGGGDFWFRGDGLADVGGQMVRGTNEAQAMFFDMAGHSRDAAVMKSYMAKLIELYRTAYPRGPAAAADPRLMVELDRFIAESPFAFPFAEYANVRIFGVRDGKKQVNIERAGGSPVFVRDRATGVITMVDEGNPALGTGLLAQFPLESTDLELAGADVFLCSDGLFNIRNGDDRNTLFSDRFAEFCADRRQASAERFKQELFDYVKRAKDESRVDDDVTIVAFPC